jgi:hypothetical protein
MKPSQNSLFKADPYVRAVAESGILGSVHGKIPSRERNCLLYDYYHPSEWVVGKIHHRMLVILLKEDEDEWLNPDIVSDVNGY